MRMDGYPGERRQAARAALNRSTQSSITWNSFPSGSANQKIVPHSSFFTGLVIFTPFFRSAASSRFASFLAQRDPIFHFSGLAFGHRSGRQFAPPVAPRTPLGSVLTSR